MGISSLTGASATLHWSYYVAATVGAWTITKTEEGWALAASLQTVNAYRITRRPLVFVFAHPKGSSRWPVLSLELTSTTLNASLGSPEKPT